MVSINDFQSFKRSYQSIDRFNQSTNHFNQSIDRINISIDRRNQSFSINRSYQSYQLINRPDRSIISINHVVIHSVNQSIDQQYIDRPTNQSFKRSNNYRQIDRQIDE
jgi:hypothetical protein